MTIAIFSIFTGNIHCFILKLLFLIRSNLLGLPYPLCYLLNNLIVNNIIKQKNLLRERQNSEGQFYEKNI